MKIKFMSCITAVTVFHRICEMGHAVPWAIFCGLLTGFLIYVVFENFKKEKSRCGNNDKFQKT